MIEESRVKVHTNLANSVDLYVRLIHPTGSLKYTVACLSLEEADDLGNALFNAIEFVRRPSIFKWEMSS